MNKRHLIAILTGAVAAMLLAIPALAATSHDANKDRIPDRWEKKYDLSLNVNQAKRDQDHDGLRNLGEYKNSTDPRDPDTDANGTDDGTQCQGHKGQSDDTSTPPDSDTGTGTVPS